MDTKAVLLFVPVTLIFLFPGYSDGRELNRTATCVECELLDETLRLAHQEILKAKILKRLGLPKVPKFTKRQELDRIPDPILNSLQSTSGYEKQHREEEIFILPNTDQIKTGGRYLGFELPAKYLMQSMVAADIWTKDKIMSISIRRTKEGGSNKAERVWRVVGLSKQNWVIYNIKRALLSTATAVSADGDFLMSHIVLVIKYELPRNESYWHQQEPPVLKLKIQTKRPGRLKRNSYCPAKTKKCCLHRFVIKFQEIGWGDFILRPLQLEANICSGSCDSAQPPSSTDFTEQARRRLYSPEIRKQVRPCCTGRTYESVKLLHFSEEDGKQYLFLTEVDNLIVTDCWCS